MERSDQLKRNGTNLGSSEDTEEVTSISRIQKPTTAEKDVPCGTDEVHVASSALTAEQAAVVQSMQAVLNSSHDDPKCKKAALELLCYRNTEIRDVIDFLKCENDSG